MAHFIDILPEAGRPGGEGEADVAVGAFGSDSWVVRPREANGPDPTPDETANSVVEQPAPNAQQS